jgi:hypothetical protein
MAIGDTVQAGLMRVDSSPILLAGQAQAKANQAFGDALGGAVEKFYQKKKDKQEREQRERAYREAGLSAEEAKAASGDKELGSLLINKMNADRNFLLAQQEVLIEREKEKRAADLSDLQMDQILQNMARQKSADQLVDDKRMEDNQFMQSLMSQTTSPQAQRQANIARPGLPALGNADARNRFMQAQLQQPQNQVPVSNLGSQDFGRFAREQGLDPTRSVQRMEALRKAELASQPKPMTPKEELDYIVKLNEELRNQAKANREASEFEEEQADRSSEKQISDTESTNNLTDFYNETRDLLDKINEETVDVTGPIEGTSVYRFFSKLGDTDDEQVRRRLEMFTRKLTLDAAQNLKGALSDKDIRFLVEQAPDMDDNPSVWKKYMGDLKIRLERNAKQKGIDFENTNSPQQSANTIDPSAPASQSTLDELEKKRQLRNNRIMMQQTLDNPNIPNYGPQ